MGTLYCLKCAQTAEADTFAEADERIDHAATSKRCSGNLNYMRWNGEMLEVGTILNPAVKSTVTSTTTSSSSKKKSKK